MLNKKQLIDLLSKDSLTQKDKVLLCLAFDLGHPKSIKGLKNIARNAGCREISKWNISSVLIKSKEMAIKTDKGWELTSKGKDYVRIISKDINNSTYHQESISLRTHLSKIRNPKTAKFVEEAVRCFEIKAYRASVVLSWIGAVSLLYDYVIQNKLSEFNIEAKLKNPKWKDARTNDDLTRMREQDFLDVLQNASIIGKNIKQQIETCLKLRNSCGHPNTLEISENIAAAHIETLMLNIFSKF